MVLCSEVGKEWKGEGRERAEKDSLVSDLAHWVVPICNHMKKSRSRTGVVSWSRSAITQPGCSPSSTTFQLGPLDKLLSLTVPQFQP